MPTETLPPSSAMTPEDWGESWPIMSHSDAQGKAETSGEDVFFTDLNTGRQAMVSPQSSGEEDSDEDKTRGLREHHELHKDDKDYPDDAQEGEPYYSDSNDDEGDEEGD